MIIPDFLLLPYGTIIEGNFNYFFSFNGEKDFDYSVTPKGGF